MGKSSRHATETALAERLEGLERALAALAADNEALAAENSALASELERERASKDAEIAEAVRAAVAEAAAAATEATRTEMQGRIDELQAGMARVVELFKLAQQRMYGSSSERVDPTQLSLFNDAEASSDGAPEPEPTDAARPRRRGGPRRVDLSKLEVVVVEHDLPEAERACPQCGSGMVEAGVEVTRKLRMVPAHLVVEEHRVRKYRCDACCKANAAGDEETKAVIVRAPRPPEAFPRSLCTPPMAAWAIDQKYVGAEPLYRTERRLAALGCPISRADLCNWVMLAWERWLVWVRDAIRGYILGRDVLHADETPVQVLREPGREAKAKSYCWVFCTTAADRPAYDYVYAETRSGSVAADHLRGWSGTLVTDGYQPYFSLPGVTNVACLAHVRRRFEDLVKLAGGDAGAAAAEGDVRLALDGRRMVDRILRAERAIGDVGPDERVRRRAGAVARAMGEFESWCQAMLPHAVPGLKLEEALRYSLAYMPYVRNALDVGAAELTNNRAERAVKPFVIGRKNWLFSDTPRGAEASCGIYSVVTTARECGLSPMRYVEWLLEELPGAGDLSADGAVDRFLPWSDRIPERLRVPDAKVEELRAAQEEPIVELGDHPLGEDE